MNIDIVNQETINNQTSLKIRETQGIKHKQPYLYLKRGMDIILSSIALVLLSPVFLIISIAIKLESKGPVFFGHTRIGKNGKHIKIYKFRSMVQNAEDLIKQFTPEQMKEYKENPDNYKGSIADFSTVVRVSLTSKSNTPDLYEIMRLLGEKRMNERVKMVG